MTKPDAVYACPLGEDCANLDELLKLRATVAQLEQLTTTDSLTGLFNHRHFLGIMQNEMQRTNRSGVATCLVMLDLDHFKQVNDQRGHEAGNQALRAVARVLQRVTRPFDVACRYGGEEFVVILPQTALPMAVKVAQRIRAVLQVEPVDFGQQSFNVTASLGVSMYRQNQPTTVEQLVDEADGYLYQAKKLGRNRVCHAEVKLHEPGTSVSQDEKSALMTMTGHSEKG
jgi:diguanylate cyclase (GGDEF)-like protein